VERQRGASDDQLQGLVAVEALQVVKLRCGGWLGGKELVGDELVE
tara:strand:+ start:1187 stop:1321 length:135 start_codon:yes stop_codon:yes gene_type:complete